jgi:dipeptidyl aminopeptidase/acylaminoacyl peptidase
VLSGQLLAAQGYAVIYPSLPLGRGDASDLKQALADEAVAAVDALVTEGLVDPKRVGVMGQSFGGFSTASILAARSDRFRAGVALAGIYDWAYAYGNLTPERWLADDGRTAFGFPAKGQQGLEAPFWRAREAYARTSPIYSVERMDAPLMILHGDLDDAYFDAARMYNALARAGKQPVLVRYWGEGHVALSESAMRDQWNRIQSWFALYLANR